VFRSVTTPIRLKRRLSRTVTPTADPTSRQKKKKKPAAVPPAVRLHGLRAVRLRMLVPWPAVPLAVRPKWQKAVPLAVRPLRHAVPFAVRRAADARREEDLKAEEADQPRPKVRVTEEIVGFRPAVAWAREIGPAALRNVMTDYIEQEDVGRSSARRARLDAWIIF
jgi:hypothetical protein